MVPMPGLRAAELAYGGISPRRIQQRSPTVSDAQFFLSTGYATPNRDTELIVCQTDDPTCSKPQIMNTVNSPGFGQAGLRLTFTHPLGLPIMLIPEARYASRDNRVTGYMIEACQDPLCQLPRLRASLPFNLTGKAYCEGTSVDVALNRFGQPSWLTLCGSELNLIHCLTATCNQTSVTQFNINRDWVYFVYLAVDSQFRFTITTTGQTPQSDITYIRCLDPDCTESIQSQLTIANRSSPTRSPIARVQVVIDPLTDLPVFHLTGSIYPSNVPVYMFVACQNVECDMSRAIYINYGGGALYEKQIIHSIHYQLKRDRLILRRTADQNNIYYFGCLDEFNAMANNYMENANCFEMIGIIDEFDSKQQQLTKTIKSIDLTLHELE
ncbi:unnamed protein product [Rotaria sp. Silwood2]|nr:unnamed protein product [Rotaria sp. Silwood2]